MIPIEEFQDFSFHMSAPPPPFSRPSRPILMFCVRRCFAYPNWTGPVKVPFPCQCAGKLANLMEKITDGRRFTVRGLFLWLISVAGWSSRADL